MSSSASETISPTDSVDTIASHRVSSQSNFCLKCNSRHKRLQRSTLTDQRSRPRNSDMSEPPHTVLLRSRKPLQRVDCKHDAHTSTARRSPHYAHLPQRWRTSRPQYSKTCQTPLASLFTSSRMVHSRIALCIPMLLPGRLAGS